LTSSASTIPIRITTIELGVMAAYLPSARFPETPELDSAVLGVEAAGQFGVRGQHLVVKVAPAELADERVRAASPPRGRSGEGASSVKRRKAGIRPTTPLFLL